MKYIFLLLIFALFMNACESKHSGKTPFNRLVKASDYKNNPRYYVATGDTIEIYYSINSCCKYCQPNTTTLKHLDFIGKKIVIPEPKDCEGCNHTTALLFIAKSKGTDTIYGGSIPPLSNCNDSTKNLNKFIVEVKF